MLFQFLCRAGTADSAAQALVDKEAKRKAAEEAQKKVDEHSVFVSNVDYGADPEELQQHFKPCGTINRITILCNKHTGKPKGWVPSSRPTLCLERASFYE